MLSSIGYCVVALMISTVASSSPENITCQTICDTLADCSYSTCNTTAVPYYCTGIYVGSNGTVVYSDQEPEFYSQHLLCPFAQTLLSHTPPSIADEPHPGCPDKLVDVDVFWWSEWPTLPSNSYDVYAGYYQRMFRLLSTNCVYMRVKKLILRVLDPQYPPAEGVDKVWFPNNDVTQSAMFTELLIKLKDTSVEEVEFLPYVFDEHSRSSWRKWSANGREVMAGVYAFAAEYNKHLPTGVKITGVTVDYEELNRDPTEYAMLSDPTGERLFKGGHTDLKFGIALTRGKTEEIVSFSWTDNFYLEMYDLGYNFSPFLRYKNQPVQLIHFLAEDVLGPNLIEAYNKHHDKVNLMWSIQSKGIPCMYPLPGPNLRCGINTDFGHWNTSAFNTFLGTVLPILGTMNVRQGVYQMDFYPLDWAPSELKGCYSDACQ